MGNANDGSSFEDLIYDLYQHLSKETPYYVSRNVKLKGPDGLREIDILIRARVADFVVTTAIECKDYRRKVDIPIVDGFASKIRDLNLNKGILVSRYGFSNSARKKAKRLGIDLVEVDEIQDVKLSVDRNIPVVLWQALPKHVEVQYTGTLHSGDKRVTIEMREMIADALEQGAINKILDGMSQRNAENAKNDFTLRISWDNQAIDEANRQLEGVLSINDFMMDVTFEVDVRYGYTDVLPRTVEKRDAETNRVVRLVLSPELPRLLKNLYIPPLDKLTPRNFAEGAYELISISDTHSSGRRLPNLVFDGTRLSIDL